MGWLVHKWEFEITVDDQWVSEIESIVWSLEANWQMAGNSDFEFPSGPNYFSV